VIKLSITEVVLNPDGTLNILDTEKFYFLVARFPGNIGEDSIQLYIVHQNPTSKYYGFVRVNSIKSGILDTTTSYNFMSTYLQYSVQELLLYNSPYYSKNVYECDSQQEFIEYCMCNIDYKIMLTQGRLPYLY